jgi:hypothetical protein
MNPTLFPIEATPRKRVKRSWSRVTTPVAGQKFTFWPTPDGLFVRRKGSPNVRTQDWASVLRWLQGDRHEFTLDGRHYAVWRAEDGIHLERGGREEHVVKWAEFIEWLDGQKLMPLGGAVSRERQRGIAKHQQHEKRRTGRPTHGARIRK